MDWGRFFEDTRKAAGAESYAQLAPMLEISDGAISHYRTGKRMPHAWTVAACLKLQKHPEPEKEAARIMLSVAHSAKERAFWRRLGAAAAVACVAILMREHAHAAMQAVAALAVPESVWGVGIMRSSM